MWRFEVFEKTIRVTCTRGDPVVTDEGLCEDENLATVGWVTEGFGVADKGGGEDGLPRDVGTRAEGLAVKDRTILEGVSMRGWAKVDQWPSRRTSTSYWPTKVKQERRTLMVKVARSWLTGVLFSLSDCGICLPALPVTVARRLTCLNALKRAAALKPLV